MPTYSEAWNLLDETKALGKIFAPFIKFKAEVIRTSIGTFRQGIEEVFKSDNPRIQKLGVLRLVSATMATMFVPAVLAAVTRAMFGYDDEQEEAIRSSLPDWQKNATMVFLPRDSEGNPQFLDLSYMNPFSVYQNPITAGMRAYTQGMESSVREAGVEALKTFFKPITVSSSGLRLWRISAQPDSKALPASGMSRGAMRRWWGVD
jgi:hypothetical protein